jgi:Nucleoside 2-deoxyribosyltransferase.
MKKAFLIYPVQLATTAVFKTIVKNIKDLGYQLYFPPYDTNQVDIAKYQNYEDNKKAIQAADMVFIVWDGKNYGSLFDAGMAIGLSKPIMTINTTELTSPKSFQDMFADWEKRSPRLDQPNLDNQKIEVKTNYGTYVLDREGAATTLTRPTEISDQLVEDEEGDLLVSLMVDAFESTLLALFATGANLPVEVLENTANTALDAIFNHAG